MIRLNSKAGKTLVKTVYPLERSQYTKNDQYNLFLKVYAYSQNNTHFMIPSKRQLKQGKLAGQITPVIATWEAEAGRSEVQSQPQQNSKALSNSVRPSLNKII